MTSGDQTSPARPVPRHAMVYVWDPLVRFFHWSLVLAFIIAYVTEDGTMALHVWAGYAAGGLVLLRLVWGFLGPMHARFTDFVCGPVKAWRYLAELVTFRAKRHIGHSPAGGVMLLLLMAGVLATVWSGLELYAVEKGKGPLAAAPLVVVTSALADDDDKGRDRIGRRHTFWDEIHESLANLTFLAVLFHIGGVVLASVAHRENLVRSMVTGWKRTE